MSFSLLLYLKPKLVVLPPLILWVYVYALDSTVMVNRNFKASPSAACVSAVSAVCKDIDIYNKDCILLRDIL